MFKSVNLVWQNSQYGTDVPRGYTVELPKGERLDLIVSVKNSDGTIPDLRTGTVSCRLVVYDLSPVYSTSAPGTTTGTAELAITLPASLRSGTYSWDLWLTIGGVRYQLMPLSAFRVVDTTFSRA